MNIQHLFPNNKRKWAFSCPLKIFELFSSIHKVNIPQQYYRILYCSHVASPRLASRKTSEGNSWDVLAGSHWESVYCRRKDRMWSRWWPRESGSSHTAWSYRDSRQGTARTVGPTETSGSLAAWQSPSIPLGSTKITEEITFIPICRLYCKCYNDHAAYRFFLIKSF